MNLADLTALVDVANVMRNNGIHRASFDASGAVTECELERTFVPPDGPAPAATPEDQELAKRSAAMDAARAKERYDKTLFMAAEGIDDELMR